MGIAVLDEAGNLKAFAREDGASMFRFDIARAKAWGAVGMGVSSRALSQRAKDNPNFFVALAATSQGKFLPQTGAVVIKDASGQVIGAVGASGGSGDEDEAICIAGSKRPGWFTAEVRGSTTRRELPPERRRTRRRVAAGRSG